MSVESSSSSSSLPKDLLIEILLCLPVKTLSRFKSVSKSWLALIDSSEFIHRHMLITTLPTLDNNSSSLGPFIFQSRHIEKNIGISWNFLSISGNHEFQVYEDLGIPPCYSKPISLNSVKNLLMVGSCNGLICLYDDELRDVSLWNPAIHQFRTLPKSSLTSFGTVDAVKGDIDFVGFGFDLETEDYKVVLMSNDTQHNNHRAQVYSLSTDSWRTLEDVVVPAHLKPNQSNNNGGYLNGSYYGLGTKCLINTCIGISGDLLPLAYVSELFSFDFTKEIFKILQLPDGVHDSVCISFHDLGIVFLSGKLTIIHCHVLNNSYDFFVLNESTGAKDSWTRLYKIGPCDKLLYRKMRPMGISNDGEYIFMVTSNGEKLWLLNLTTQVMKALQWDRGKGIWRAYAYRRSLVPVYSTRISAKGFL